MKQINQRKKFSLDKIQRIVSYQSANKLNAKGEYCIYLTGSFGRLEACEKSDVDLFIVSKPSEDKRDNMSNIDEILIKSNLIKMVRCLEFPEFDSDAKYLEHYSALKFINNIGKNCDDYENTLSGRLLLLLESKCVLGDSIYKNIVEDIINAYWKDFENHKNDFMPAFFANDVLLLWRNFCVGYEKSKDPSKDGDINKKKIKNFKLKHSRMMTCYSSLIYLISIFSDMKTVSQDNAKEMVEKTPIERLQYVSENCQNNIISEKCKSVIQRYDDFLNEMLKDDEFIVSNISDDKSLYFGNCIYEIIYLFGELNDHSKKFRRMIFV